jgi:hypothetical protein
MRAIGESAWSYTLVHVRPGFNQPTHRARSVHAAVGVLVDIA